MMQAFVPSLASGTVAWQLDYSHLGTVLYSGHLLWFQRQTHYVPFASWLCTPARLRTVRTFSGTGSTLACGQYVPHLNALT